MPTYPTEFLACDGTGGASYDVEELSLSKPENGLERGRNRIWVPDKASIPKIGSTHTVESGLYLSNIGDSQACPGGGYEVPLNWKGKSSVNLGDDQVIRKENVNLENYSFKIPTRYYDLNDEVYKCYDRDSGTWKDEAVALDQDGEEVLSVCPPEDVPLSQPSSVSLLFDDGQFGSNRVLSPGETLRFTRARKGVIDSELYTFAQANAMSANIGMPVIPADPPTLPPSLLGSIDFEIVHIYHRGWVLTNFEWSDATPGTQPAYVWGAAHYTYYESSEITGFKN